MHRYFIATALTVILSLPIFAQSLFFGSWSGTIEAGATKLTIVFNLSEDESGTIKCTLDSPDQSAKGIRAEVTAISDIMLEVSVPSIGASYKGMMFKDSIFGTFSQLGSDFPLKLTKGIPELKRPQTPKEPFPYTSEEVVFTNEAAGASLAGTLLLPEGAGPETPVILMVTGSGQENRDEEIYEHKPFLVIADYLARKGIATLRYDDRNYGQSKGGDLMHATTLDFMHDAGAGIEYLRAKGIFGKVGVLGHSEGGNIAFMLGAAGKVDFAISLAGVGVKGDEALTAQTNRLLEINGQDQRMTVEMFRANIALQGNAWLNWFIDYDPLPDIKACNCPTFAVNGDKDFQVLSSLNLGSIKENLPASEVNFVKEYPSLNHLFQHSETGSNTEYRLIEETFSEEVLEDMARWIQGLL